jgi:hypothetical protein
MAFRFASVSRFVLNFLTSVPDFEKPPSIVNAEANTMTILLHSTAKVMGSFLTCSTTAQHSLFFSYFDEMKNGLCRFRTCDLHVISPSVKARSSSPNRDCHFRLNGRP